VSTLRIYCLDSISEDMGEALRRFLTFTFGLDTELITHPTDLSELLDPSRAQYESTGILRLLAREHAGFRGHVLGLTEADLYVPMLSFLFGHAQLGGTVALVSLARLRQEFYELQSDPPLLLERLMKEAAHELGHAFGMRHCANAQCCMALSTAIEQVDAKEADFCSGCRSLLREFLAKERSDTAARGAEEVPS